MKKMLICRETLGAEMRHAANKNWEFSRLLRRLREDYNISPIDTEEGIKTLNYHYNTLLFMAGEKRVRHNNVA